MTGGVRRWRGASTAGACFLLGGGMTPTGFEPVSPTTALEPTPAKQASWCTIPGYPAQGTPSTSREGDSSVFVLTHMRRPPRPTLPRCSTPVARRLALLPGHSHRGRTTSSSVAHRAGSDHTSGARCAAGSHLRCLTPDACCLSTSPLHPSRGRPPAQRADLAATAPTETGPQPATAPGAACGSP